MRVGNTLFSPMISLSVLKNAFSSSPNKILHSLASILVCSVGRRFENAVRVHW